MFHEECLKMNSELELNELINALEMSMLANDRNIANYDENTSRNRVYELYVHTLKLEDLRNRAVAHNFIDIFEQCTEYIIKAESQMNILRNKYI